MTVYVAVNFSRWETYSRDLDTPATLGSHLYSHNSLVLHADERMVGSRNGVLENVHLFVCLHDELVESDESLSGGGYLLKMVLQSQQNRTQALPVSCILHTRIIVT